MATLRQIHANQLNSLNSTGPQTPEGKAASRANALKHGLSGAGIVLPDEEKAEIAERNAQWNSALRPYDNVDGWCAETVATEAVRIERCRTLETSMREEDARRAGETWDQDRRLAAAKLSTKLTKRPEVVALELASTTQGVDLLLERWQNLAAILENGDWNDAQRSLALDLLGIPRDQREAINPLLVATRPGGIGLSGLVTQQVNKLTSLKPILDVRDGREQAAAMLGIGALSAEIRRIQRYESACMRRLQWAYSRLKSIPFKPASRYDEPASRQVPASHYEPARPSHLPWSPPLLVNGCLADSLKEPTAYEEATAYEHVVSEAIPTSDFQGSEEVAFSNIR